MKQAELVERFGQRDRRALARLLTLASHGEFGARSASKGESKNPLLARRAHIIALTGGAGVGKSSLIGKLIEFLRGQGKTVAVLACDPQSPITGGALLGDRVRMPSSPEDAGVFIRSLATPSGQQGVAPHLAEMSALLGEYGFEVVLIETVGAGQGDTAVRDLADAVVVLLQPQTGDDMQWEKAGLLEIADVVVVHKADLPGADRMKIQLAELLNLPGCREVPVVLVSAAKSQGLAELWTAVEGVRR